MKQKINDTKKYINSKRVLNVPGIQARFDTSKKLRHDEIDKLFEFERHKPFKEIQYRYLEYGIRYQGIWDIETSDFDPNHNFIICYNFTIRDLVTEKLEHMADSMTKKDIQDAVDNTTFDFDRRLLTTLSHNINMCNQIVGHFSSKFDYPFFRTRCLLTGQDSLIPEYGELVSADTWRYMKNTLKAKRNTLKNFIQITGGNDEKTYVDLKYWYITHFKDHKLWQKSMNYIQDHCVKDVRMTLNGLKKVELFNPISRLKI